MLFQPALTLRRTPDKFIDIIRYLGLGTNLKLSLDAGNASSYTSGQSWLDQSGSGYDFFLGVDGSATATDPTFTGSAGGLSSGEYFLCDGGDNFRYDTSNEAWMNNLHKDNALFTLAGWYYPVAAAGVGLIGTSGNNVANVGVAWIVNPSSGNASLVVAAGGSAARTVTQAVSAASAAWQFFAISVDEAASSAFHYRNGVAASPAAASYTTPSSSAATHAMEICAAGNGAARLPNTSRVAGVFAWEGVALTAAQIDSVFNATRRRFGI